MNEFALKVFFIIVIIVFSFKVYKTVKFKIKNRNNHKLKQIYSTKKIKKLHWPVKLFLLIILLIILYFSYPLIILIIVYGTMSIQHTMAYNKSFETVYQVKDYNDSRINFYTNELEKNSKNLVNAKGIVDIFEYDSKVDLTLECIQYYLKEHNETDWIEKGSKVRKNARNKFSTSDDLVKRAKANEDNMGKNFYLYDMNLVNETISDITNLWQYKSKKSLCEQNLSANQLYDTFLTNYLAKYIDNHISSKQRRLSSSDNRDFLARKHNQEKEWLEQITKKSSLEIYKQFSNKNITLEDVDKDNKFKASLKTNDVAFSNNEYIVADAKRGIELWIIDDKDKFIFKKILSDKYRAFRIKIVNNILFVAANGKQRGSFFLAFSYDEKTKSLIELYKIKVGKYSKIHDWKFFDNNNKVAMVHWYDRMLILDISKPNNLKIIRKEKKDRTNQASADLAISKTTNTIYELTSWGLNIFDINGDTPSKVNKDLSFKGHQGLAINQNENILYTIHITWEKEVFLYKYSLVNPVKPKLILSKSLDINFDGWNGGSFPENMKIHKDKLYIATENKIHIFDKKMNKIGNMKTPGLRQFHFIEDKIIYTSGKNGVFFIY